jgi:hypothetical protein
MKRIKLATILLLIHLANTSAFSQQVVSPQKNILSILPDKVEVTKQLFSDLIQLKPGDSTVISFTNNAALKVVIISNQVVFQNLQTVIMKSTDSNNTLFQLSKIINNDHCEFYSGRIINTDDANCFLISKDEKENYVLNKTELKNIIQDCSH